MLRILALSLALLVVSPALALAKLLVPMDASQTDHLKAYGLAYWVLVRGKKAEWLLNYRGGSFLLLDDAETEREANVRGVSFEKIGGGAEATIRATIADENMESVALEKAPRVGVYIPPNTPPWDDAVTLALEYADIPYTKLWDEEVLKGDLTKVDWLHLHHEDFTGQHGKFYAAYHNMPWYLEEERVQQAMAAKLGFAKVTQLKGAVAQTIRDYVGRGGFMFGMCSATDTYDIALASAGLDIAEVVYDGDPSDLSANARLDYGRTLAFKDFRLEMDPFLYRFSDIDVTAEASQRGPNTVFTLFDFSAKNDPVPTMLVQDHVNAVPEFLGQSTGFRRSKMKSHVLALGEVEGSDEVKYLHGQFGRGTFTFLGGHDPEDYQHMVGDPQTDLSKYRHSPGYRLILNNVLFPAAEKKKQRT
ncbi:MAG: asparagine synthetase B [Candidatus Eisenbacteria bacterium]|uniref:Asparagine synthetase B n=1 Tax=Eiseniibacteriota bacterium TaxID=2212470 RepID=A0A849SFR9_UNCEI|nr:asparagine synthetase B [Candidatus Eisenbacteria bacterium]